MRYLNISLPAMQGAGGLLLVNVNEGWTLALAVVMKVLRESGVSLVARIAGISLSLIAVQMIADAVRAFIKVG